MDEDLEMLEKFRLKRIEATENTSQNIVKPGSSVNMALKNSSNYNGRVTDAEGRQLRKQFNDKKQQQKAIDQRENFHLK